MRCLVYLVCSLFLLAPALFGQHLISFGIKGGIPLTDAFSDYSVLIGDVETIHSFSSSKNYVAGAMIELWLPIGFSVEADALYRPLNLTTNTRIAVSNILINTSTDISSWEFPILGKYHFIRAPILSPYVEAGPIFRVVASPGSYLSDHGFTLGGGVDIKLLILRISPEIRYARWGQDAVGNSIPYPSNVNQAEFLVGLSF